MATTENGRWAVRRLRARAIVALTAAVTVALTTGCPSGHADPRAPEGDAAVPVLRPTVLAEIPHDASAYTEGFELAGAALYEGTGLQGQSQLRELDPATGAVRRAIPLPGGYFGEGITVVNDRIWQLTYRDGVAIEWDKATMTPLREIPLDGESWGLCRDGDRLVRSDGTERLHFHDATEFAETGTVIVTRDGETVRCGPTSGRPTRLSASIQRAARSPRRWTPLNYSVASASAPRCSTASRMPVPGSSC